MKFNVLYILISVLVFSSCAEHIDYIQSYYYNEKYNYYLQKQLNEKALESELLSKENLQNYYQQDSNLGIIFNLMKKNEDAKKSFDQSVQNLDKQFLNDLVKKNEALFLINFNLGVFYGGQSEIDLALIAYQKALDINPLSVEVKTNIELLLQKQKEDQKQKENQKKQDDQNEKDKNKKSDSGQSEEPKDDKNQSDKDKDQNKKNDRPQDRSKNQKYQPKPFKGDQLSEGDVKKILGELSQQDKKIRSQFDKKEKIESPNEGKNEKDW